MCESYIIAEAVISPVDYSNLSWLWPQETARCHQHHTLFGLLSWSSPLLASTGKTVNQRQVEKQIRTPVKGKLNLVKMHLCDTRVKKNYTEQNKITHTHNLFCVWLLLNTTFSAAQNKQSPSNILHTYIHIINCTTEATRPHCIVSIISECPWFSYLSFCHFYSLSLMEKQQGWLSSCAIYAASVFRTVVESIKLLIDLERQHFSIPAKWNNEFTYFLLNVGKTNIYWMYNNHTQANCFCNELSQWVQFKHHLCPSTTIYFTVAILHMHTADSFLSFWATADRQHVLYHMCQGPEVWPTGLHHQLPVLMLSLTSHIFQFVMSCSLTPNSYSNNLALGTNTGSSIAI